MLTFRKLLDAAKDNAERKVLLAGKVEDMINTVVRQIAFYDFECKLHDARRGGELTAEDIGALWMSVQGRSLGPAFDFMDGYETFWAYIPHFVHSPFYVYAYAFGDGLVNALYAVYEENPAGFRTSISTCSRQAARCTTRNFWPPSASTPRTRPSGTRASA